jgi:pimeloyl-ACP methyl ester carboxylesterase
MSILRRGSLSIDCIDEGKGPPVVLAHSSVSGNRQWKRLIERLRGRYRVLAPNLLGYGKTTPWTGTRTQTVEDAVQVLLGVCEGLGAPIRLVGHSWGGYLAIAAAKQLGERVSHLALYEPMMPGLLRGHGRAKAWEEAAGVYADVRRLSGAGDWEALAHRFTDYFNGDGAWQATSAERREMIAAHLPPNRHEWDAATPPVTTRMLAPIAARGLVLCGTKTRIVLKDVVELLRAEFPQWGYVAVPGAGHMGPLTHAEEVNSAIEAFLDS